MPLRQQQVRLHRREGDGAGEPGGRGDGDREEEVRGGGGVDHERRVGRQGAAGEGRENFLVNFNRSVAPRFVTFCNHVLIQLLQKI